MCPTNSQQPKLHNKQSLILQSGIVLLLTILNTSPNGVLSLVRHIPKINIAIYYQTLCTDSRTFFYKQLMPAYTRMPDLMNVTLIPFGQTLVHENEGDVEFLCPHGPPECKGMLVHACAINIVPRDLVLQYVFCMIMDNWNGLVIGEKCAKKLEIDWHSVLGCVNSNKSTMYLLHYKELTMSLNPPLTQVPRVVINGIIQLAQHLQVYLKIFVRYWRNMNQ
ncbi:GILT-like protein 1 isoform X2 [Schistocerca gregaria]|uniref:GILT-like protein 1 isoform X2 n=1 Tax=Schistocerca gregaria TaxID=7010 RepID=UPI00211ECD72|nr:GILT-like protein 1 isoform X2 [Schistocerca gregaria]